MNLVSVLAEIIGAVLVLVGLSVLSGRSRGLFLDGLFGNRAVLWLAGFVTFVLGAVVVALDNVWSSGWQVVIPIVGCLMMLKGVFLSVFPGTATAFYRKMCTEGLGTAAGILAGCLGLVLVLPGCTATHSRIRRSWE